MKRHKKDPDAFSYKALRPRVSLPRNLMVTKVKPSAKKYSRKKKDNYE
jgi:hypothetical protein